MKTISLKALFIFFLSLNSAIVLAQAPEYADLIGSLKSAQDVTKKVGTIESPCLNCLAPGEEPKVIDLKDEITLKDLTMYKRNLPYVVRFKRTKDSPLKSVLHYKNNYTVCEKLHLGGISVSSLLIDCAYTSTILEDNNLNLDLKKLPPLKEGEEQIFEIKFSKPDINESFYSVDVEVIKGPPAKAKIGDKFFGGGYNVKLVEPDLSEDKS